MSVFVAPDNLGCRLVDSAGNDIFAADVNIMNILDHSEDFSSKSTTQQIRERFDNDVERFSNLDTGQQTTLDATLTMELCTEAASRVAPDATELLDIGCGAGNYTLKMLSKVPHMNCTLNDLSMPMLERAQERTRKVTTGTVTILQEDVRLLSIGNERFNIILASAVLHHLRTEAEWEQVFGKIYTSLKPGGCVWISDLVTHDHSEIRKLFVDQYATYLDSLGGVGYREKVLAYIQQEDSPRSLVFQLNLLEAVGFRQVEVLHKNGCFAAFGAIK